MEEDYIGLEEDIAFESEEKTKRLKRATYMVSAVVLMLVVYVIVTLSSYHG